MKHTGEFTRYAFISLLIVLAVSIHIRFCRAVPDPFFFPDSASYLHPIFSVWTHGGWDLPIERSLGYPLFLLGLLKIFPHFSVVLAAQHAVWLTVAIIAAWISHQQFRASLSQSCLIFFLTAALPRGIFYAHSILTESLFIGFSLAALACYLGGIETRPRRYWIAAGVLLAIAVMIRPAGDAWVAALFLSALCHQTNFHVRRGILVAAGVFVLMIIPVCVANIATRGFFGLQKIEGIGLFGSVAQYLEPTRLADTSVRAILSPFYATAEARQQLKASNWVRFSPQGPGQALQKFTSSRIEYDNLLTRLSHQAIKDHPILLIRDQCWALFDFLWNRSVRPEGTLSKEHTMMEGLSRFREMTTNFPVARNWIVFKPQNVSSYVSWMESHPVYPYASGGFPWILLWPFVWLMDWVPRLMLILLPFLYLKQETRQPTTTLLLIMVFHIVLCNLGGGEGPARYALPIEPLYLVLCLAGIQSAWTWGKTSLKGVE